MATASSSVDGFTLTGNSIGGNTTYDIALPTGEVYYVGAPQQGTTLVKQSAGTYKLGLATLYLSAENAVTLAAGLSGMYSQVNNSIKSQTTTVPAPAPAPTPAPKTAATPVPAPANVVGGGGSFGGGGASGSWATAPPTTTNPVKAGGTTANVVPQTGTTAPNSGQGTTAAKANAQSTPAQRTQQPDKNDWRVRLALSPDASATYLYKDTSNILLSPLNKTNGVIFPYTPIIQVNYAATYEQTAITHSNYKINQYGSSSVDSVTITCDFTAQDVFEANYVLAVIHFFRSMTKMFYGQDQMPKRGTPPPLCYLYGLGDFQFSSHPLAITGFGYTLPNDVDYIPTTGATPAAAPQPSINPQGAAATRTASLSAAGVAPGGGPSPVVHRSTAVNANTTSTTWVPTKINMSISCLPMMSRNQVSNIFSLKDYANGNIYAGSKNADGTGFW